MSIEDYELMHRLMEQDKERSDRVNEVFSIQVHNHQLFEQGKQGVWLNLPTTTEKLQAALRDVWITADNPQDFFINGYSCPEDRHLAIPYDMVLAADVDELNFLAARLGQLDAAEIAELNAALQNPRGGFESIGQIIDYTENVDYYVHLLDVMSAGQLGDYYLNRSGIHEVAHARLYEKNLHLAEDKRPDKATREVQAESVAYAVCQYWGLDTSDYSFGYIANWSSGRNLEELQASLETIQAAANDLINEMEIHLLELQRQREAQQEQQPKEQEAAYQLDNGNTLFVQTTETGYDYTLYGPDFKALDGGQLDNPDLSLLEARDEILADLEAQVLVTDILASDALATFQEAAEQANAIPAPAQAEEEQAPALDPAAEPVVTVLWSESSHLKEGQTMPLHEADTLFAKLDAEYPAGMGYDKTKFRIDFTFRGKPDNYEGRQDFGDGDGFLIQHIQSYHEYYAQDESWKNHVIAETGLEGWEQDKAERDMLLGEFVSYMKLHCNLSHMEQEARRPLLSGEELTLEQEAYFHAVLDYVQECRPLLNQGQYQLPEPPKLSDFDQTLQDYKEQVQAEIAQEAAAAGMTVEEYAVAGYEAPEQDSFSIYQIKSGDETRDYRFEPYDRLQAMGRSVNRANYDLVYTAPLDGTTTLEDIYRTFNIEHPADFKGHSLSVSDVVVLHQGGKDTAHYCDSFGFQQVPEFLRENPLRTTELSTEQNENMIDGVINNTPSIGELEAKVKAGEQVSLTALADAAKAEAKKPKAKQSRKTQQKKPSIRAQLKAVQEEQAKKKPAREKSQELEV